MTLSQIGTTWHNQAIQLLTLDARDWLKQKDIKDHPQAKTFVETDSINNNLNFDNLVQLDSSMSVVAKGLKRNLQKKTMLAQTNSASE